MWVICLWDIVKGGGGMPTERFYRDVYCRDLKLTSRFLAFKPFKLPSYCPSIQLDISYLATFIIPLCPEKSYLIFQNICVRKENHVCSRNCSGICEKAVFQWQELHECTDGHFNNIGTKIGTCRL